MQAGLIALYNLYQHTQCECSCLSRDVIMCPKMARINDYIWMMIDRG